MFSSISYLPRLHSPIYSHCVFIYGHYFQPVSFTVWPRLERWKDGCDIYKNQIIKIKLLCHQLCSARVTYRTLPDCSEYIRFKFYSKINHTFTYHMEKNTFYSENVDENVFQFSKMNIITLFNIQTYCTWDISLVNSLHLKPTPSFEKWSLLK